MSTNVARVQVVLSGLAKLLPLAQQAENAADQAFLSWVAQNEGLDKGKFQYTQTALNQLNALDATYSADFRLVSDIINYGSAVSSWAANEDQRVAYGLPLLPYPAVPADIAAEAKAQSVSLVPQDPPAPVPVVQGEAFMVPGGYVAVICLPPVTPTMYMCLNGDTVPDGMKVTDPNGMTFTRHVAVFPFGQENWYTTA